MAASSSSKVAALANIFQQNDGGGRRGSGVYDDGSLDRSTKKSKEAEGESKEAGGGLKYFKNSVNIRRTSSQVARFSSARKMFESKDKDSRLKGNLNQSHTESPVTKPFEVSPNLTNTLPQRLCSPAMRSGSKIPIGDFWTDKKDKKNLAGSDVLNNVASEPTVKINFFQNIEDDKENVSNRVVRNQSALSSSSSKQVKAKHINNYESLASDVESPVLNRAETQFSGLMETIMSPEYKKAELDFELIAQENISTDNILDGLDENKSFDHVIEEDKIYMKVNGVEELPSPDKNCGDIENVCTQAQDYSTNEEVLKDNKRLQSTPKDSKTKCQERNTNDLSRTRESFHGFEVTSEVILDKTNEDPTTNYNTTETSNPEANASSLGSSLVGQSVTSWLGTTSNNTNEVLRTNEVLDDESKDKSKEVKHKSIIDESQKQISSTSDRENVSSSDYVSGDSCDIVSPPASNIQSVQDDDIDGSNDDNQDPADNGKVHFFEDGHFWYEGSPLSVINKTENFEDLKIKKIKVRFSTSPIKHFSTFSNEDYDRRNEDIDPAAATAEYELEKRLEKMKMVEVKITKNEAGLGIRVLGVGVGPSSNDSNEKLGIFIKGVVDGGAVHEDGNIKVGDQLVSVDGTSLVGVTQDQAAEVLKGVGDEVCLVVARNPDPDADQVLQLIHQNTDTEGENDVDMDVSEVNETSKVFLDSLQPAVIDEADELDVATNDDILKLNNGMEGKGNISTTQDIKGSPSNENSVQNVEELLEDYLKEDNDVPEIVIGTSLSKCQPTKVKVIATLPTNQVENESKEEANNVCEAVKEGGKCCDYKAKYKSLLDQQNKTEATLRQVSSNLTLVTNELMSRDRIMQKYIETVSQIFSLDGPTEDSQELINNMLDLRQSLLRSPHIPPPPNQELPRSEFDQVLGSTLTLNSEYAKDKIRLNHRSLKQRRTLAKYSTKTPSLSSTTPVNLDMFRRTIVRASLPIITHQRSVSCSNSTSDVSDVASTASSVQSVPDSSVDGETVTKKKKSKSLLKQMKRRMSFTSNKGF